MKLSVVVATLNDRELLASTLDALASHAPDAEIIVVDGPSADGTTGMVRERGDVDVLVQLSERNRNVARNAGIEVASGDAIALVGQEMRVDPSWADALRSALDEGADAITGPIQRTLATGMTTDDVSSTSITGTDVTLFDCNNVAFTRAAIEALDGFDEYLQANGDRDAAHRLAAQDMPVSWREEMSVRTEYEADDANEEWGWKYRSFAYCLTKNYGIRPTVVGRTLRRAIADAGTSATDLLSGAMTPTRWLGTGRTVVTNIAIGTKDGLVARWRDRTPRRNPHGISTRDDRAVERYDWR